MLKVREVLTFLASGGVAALVNLASGDVIARVAPEAWSYDARLAFGFSLGTVVSFILNRHITFAEQKGELGVQLARYIVTALISIGVAAVAGKVILAVLHVFVGERFPREYLELAGHVGAIGVTTVYNFFAIKYFALRKTEPLGEVDAV